MGLKCINFTNGLRLPIFPSSGSEEYEENTRVFSPWGVVSMYAMKNAIITAADSSGKFINPGIVGQTLTDMDGNTWKFTKKDDNTINLLITSPSNDTMSCDLANATSYGPTAYNLVAVDDNMTLQVHCISDIDRVVARSLTNDRFGKGITEGYVENWNGEYSFYSDITLVDYVGDGQDDNWSGKFGRMSTQMRNIFAGDTFCHIQGLHLTGRGAPSEDPDEYINANDFYIRPFYGSGTSYTLSSFNFNNSISDFDDDEKIDPFAPGGSTEPSDGIGDFDDTSDEIAIPDLPTLDATDTGFITLFNPSLTELRSLASYMWSNLFDIDTFRKLFADPMDCILGLSIVPVAVPNGASKEVRVGNIGTGISMTTAAQQYIKVQCGSINLKEYWGAYLDYAPYTKAEIYLPYIGTHPLAIDDVMNKTITVEYHVDILSGACTAFVKCGASVLYEFIGQCSSSVPISGNDWTNVVNGALTIASAIGSMVATGGLSAPVAASDVTSFAGTAMSMKPSVEKSGSMSGTGGMLAIQTPYIILTRPRQALPSGQNSYSGYPSFITEHLGSITGYTEVDSVHLKNIPCTGEELAEIEALLKGGVIL